ncbi:hypothetical protein A2791_03875 [Candidatus Saccharibacteria bacterium RIFCSPHIGHO2_01_FULL_46_30]|nr:MAG: hypothetical protein A2791_03875 [Candidatus Saccharibacteria bacterium RIFCSPHIGHO2_01_FULL_46_30]
MQTYDEMVDTELAYLGKIPRSWQLTPASMLFTENKQNNQSLISQIPLQFKMGDIIRKKVDIDDKLLEEIRRYTVVEKGDIMMNGLNLNYDFATQRVALVGEGGCITPAYISLRTRENYSPKYATYLLKALDGQKVLNGWGTGIRLTLNYTEFKKYRLPKPDIKIQQQIADFLDQETAKIDNLIAKQERLLELLEEKRRATITHAVTRGLNPSVELKETNIPWLGKVPEHWKVVRISRIFAENKDSNNDLGSLEPMKYKFGTIVPKNVKITEETQDELRRYNLIQPDDIMINGLNLNYDFVTQRVAVVEHYGCMTPAYISIRKRNSDVITGYYTYLLKALDSQKVLNGWGTGIRLTLNYSELKKKEVLYPPIAEQSSIVELLDSYIKKTSILESKIQTQIKLLKERRTSLISHAVTGKVRI